MERNTVLAVVLSAGFLIFWWYFYQPQPGNPVTSAPAVVEQVQTPSSKELNQKPSLIKIEASKQLPQKDVVYETPNYKAVFTTKGAAIKEWGIKEKSGKIIQLNLAGVSQLSTFENINFQILKNENGQISFASITAEGVRITKTFTLSDKFMHKLTVNVEKKPGVESYLDMTWGPGLGCDVKEKDDNIALTRALAYTTAKPHEMQKLKPGSYKSQNYTWGAVDNRYFLCALIPDKPEDLDFFNVTVGGKKQPPSLSAQKSIVKDVTSYETSLSFYLGPKIQAELLSFNNNLEQTIDFGWFGFLGKGALYVLRFIHNITQNYGWSIVILTIFIQILVFPLTIKSFKAQADMKKLQPIIKDIQTKYKSDPKRLNIEMLNVYKTHKVNPLGGCLPMLLQLPIFWALFTTLRNAYEIRGAEWIFWIKDLSAADPYYVLPIVMGVGMLLQQKLVSVSMDPAQEKIMMLMPIIFTFMFLNFPAGLVLYWITNSILTMSEQYVFMKRAEKTTTKA